MKKKGDAMQQGFHRGALPQGAELGKKNQAAICGEQQGPSYDPAPNERREEGPLAGVTINSAANRLHEATQKLWLPVNTQNV